GGWGLLAGGAAAGLVAASWQKIKSVILWLTGFLVMRVELNGDIAHAASYFFWSRHRRDWNRCFVTWQLYYRPARKLQRLALEIMRGSHLCWVGWRPVLVVSDGEARLNLYWLRGLFNGNRLLKDLQDLTNKLAARECSTRFLVRTVQGSSFGMD